jgi:REP element-mobilizing transposase RayT
MPQTFYQIWIHLVWATKNRVSIFHKDKRKIIFQHIYHMAREKGYRIDMINGIEDYVQCLISLQPKYALSKVVNGIKGESSRWINENQILPDVFEWQDSYAAFSVSNQNDPVVRKYILNQELHHAGFSFQEELDNLKKLSSKP